MNRLQKKLKELKKTKQKALVAFVTAGYPNLNATKKIIPLLANSGADIIELGVPFSDPIADGPTIQYSSDCALRKGINLNQILKLIKEIRKTVNIPILLMGYLNPFMRNGLKNTANRIKSSGADGLIIPDAIPEELKQIKKTLKINKLSLVQFVAPNTPESRMKLINKLADSFIYVVSLTGVTGGRKKLPDHIKDYLKKVSKKLKHPKFLGFGISNPEQVRQIRNYVDGVIIGSKIIKIIQENKNNYSKKLDFFIRSMKNALN